MDVDLLAEDFTRLLAAESRSLARHLDDDRPYLDAGSYAAWNQVKHLGHTSREIEERLIGLMQRLGLSPVPVTFDSSVADFHYMDLKTLCPLLAEEKRRQVKLYERAIEHAGPDAETVAELEDLKAQTQSEVELLTSCGVAVHV